MEIEEVENELLNTVFKKSGKKLVLTNKRLLVHDRKGNFYPKWELGTEIPLEEIKEAYGTLDTITSLSILVLTLKNGEQIHITFALSSVGTSDPEKSETLRDKYLAVIKDEIKKLQNYIKEEKLMV